MASVAHANGRLVDLGHAPRLGRAVSAEYVATEDGTKRVKKIGSELKE